MIRSHGYVAQVAARRKRQAEERAAKDRVNKAHTKGVHDGERRERERHTFECAVADDHKLIGERPKYEFIRIALAPSRVAWAEHDPRELYLDMSHVVTFRAVRKAWASGHGHTVVWFDWERVS
jgi:hypothetical protein